MHNTVASFVLTFFFLESEKEVIFFLTFHLKEALGSSGRGTGHLGWLVLGSSVLTEKPERQ